MHLASERQSPNTPAEVSPLTFYTYPTIFAQWRQESQRTHTHFLSTRLWDPADEAPNLDVDQLGFTLLSQMAFRTPRSASVCMCVCETGAVSHLDMSAHALRQIFLLFWVFF